MGFSDITALHTAFQQRCRMATVHCAMAMSLSHTASDYTRKQFAQGLQSPFSARSLSLPEGTVLEPHRTGLRFRSIVRRQHDAPVGPDGDAV